MKKIFPQEMFQLISCSLRTDIDWWKSCAKIELFLILEAADLSGSISLIKIIILQPIQIIFFSAEEKYKKY